MVDDFVIRRNDGAPAYNLAVVVDDAWQEIGEVVRGDDLLETTPRQRFLGDLLGLPAPSYAHVPLVLGADGARLAKRHGAVTLADLDAGVALRWMAGTLGLGDATIARGDARALRSRARPARAPHAVPGIAPRYREHWPMANRRRLFGPLLIVAAVVALLLALPLLIPVAQPVRRGDDRPQPARADASRSRT